VENLAAVCRNDGIRLFFDAAHAFGSLRKGVHVGGFGDAEVFSLSPTKVLVGCEGGIIATNDDVLAERCRIGRDYANPGDYDCRFVGLNARMSELHAAVALASLDGLEERITVRNEIANLYKSLLEGTPGVLFPTVRDDDRSTYKDFTILIDETEFGCNATRLAEAMGQEGIDTRRYYAPPVHTMRAYRGVAPQANTLDVTVKRASQVISLPLWIDMGDETVQRVGWAISRIQAWHEKDAGSARVIDLRDVKTSRTLEAQ
jgi:dTDP-4-amino-4,6-dideoxygalactose transaminase